MASKKEGIEKRPKSRAGKKKGAKGRERREETRIVEAEE